MYHRILFAALLAASVLPVHAGLVIKSTAKNLRSGEAAASLVKIDGDNLRIEVQQDEARENEMIFRGDLRSMYVLQHDHEQYIEVNKEMFAGLSQQMNDAMAEVRAQMATMPPEQRAMMEKMMGGMLGGGEKPQPVIEVKPNGRTREVEGLTCTGYTVTRDGEIQSEIYTVPLAKADHAEEALAVMKNMGAFFEELVASIDAPIASMLAENPFDSLKQIDGFPLVIIRHDAMGPAEETVMSLPEAADLDEAEFTPPAGYTKVNPAENL